MTKAPGVAGPLPLTCPVFQYSAAASLRRYSRVSGSSEPSSVKTPTIALFALTNPPEQWGPWRVPHKLLNHDVPCRLCYSRICPYDHECLRLVTPAAVLDAAVELLGSVPAPALAGVLP